MNEAKIKSLENKMFKLLKNKPYNVVRSQCDQIGRQIYELSSKVKGGKEEQSDLNGWCKYKSPVTRPPIGVLVF